MKHDPETRRDIYPAAQTAALVGMAAHFGACNGLSAFARALYEGGQAVVPLPTRPLSDLLRDVVGAALADAGLAGAPATLLLVTETGAETGADAADPGAGDGDALARQIAADLGLTEPTAAVPAASGGVLGALEIARRLLAAGETRAVVIGAAGAGLSPGAGGDQPPPAASEPATLSYGAPAPGCVVGAGAGALVLQRPDQATRRPYALVEGLGFAAAPLTPEAVAQAARQALADAGIAPDEPGYLELCASGIAREDAAELAGLRQVYQAPAPDDLRCAIGSVKVNIGHTGPAAALASLIKAALCLARRAIPAVPGWTGPADPAAWQGSAFYVPAETRPWFIAGAPAQHSGPVRRVVALSDLGHQISGGCAHAILGEVPGQPQRASDYLATMPLKLLPLAGASQADLFAQIGALEQAAQADTPLAHLAAQCFETWRSRTGAPYALALVAQNQAELLREIERARSGLPDAFATGEPWKTPAGSAFSPQPLGKDHTVAFVYPGAFNAYFGMGRDMFQLFPELWEQIGSIISDMPLIFGDRLLYPRSMAPLAPEEVKAREAAMVEDAIRMLEIGTSFAMICTMIMRDCFGLQPSFAFGYSQGETTMMHALRVWPDSEAMGQSLRGSNVYTERLTGPRHAVRELWGVGRDEPSDNELWANYVLMTGAEKVRPHLADEPRVYLSIIDSPREVVISGDPVGCQRVIAKVKCRSLRMPFTHPIHSPPLKTELAELARINTATVHPVPGVTFYSAADYGPLDITSEGVGQAMARVYYQALDFPRLVQRVYAAGARIFVELGPMRNCSHWIETILAGQAYAAAAINKRGVDDHISIIRLLALLVSHQVPLDLARLYGPPSADEREPARPPEAPAAPMMLPAPAARPWASQWAEQPTDHPPGPNGGHAVPAGPPVAIVDELEAIAHLQEQVLVQSAARLTAAHSAFLQTRHESFARLHHLVEENMTVEEQRLPAPGSTAIATDLSAIPVPTAPVARSAPAAAPLIDEERVREFTLGSVAACFGPDYAIYEQQRTPRTPNGDLQMFNRVLRVEGAHRQLEPGTLLVSEYDVPVDAWFYTQNAYSTVPCSILMEMAMQPCGFLSAYLGSALLFPQADLYFRNLDGRGQLLRLADIRGKTITDYATLISSTFIQDIIIQKYSFRLACDGTPFYEGDAVFGYFTPDSLSNQIGLDGGKSVATWYRWAEESGQLATLPITTIDLHTPAARQRFYQAPAGKPFYRLASKQLDLLDQVVLVAGGGHQGQGYIYASKRIDPADWFFRCHFFQDPVMPGSLGVEGIIQAIQVYALHFDLGQQFASPHFEYAPGDTMTWKYRGQIVRESQWWSLEVHVTHIERLPDQVRILANASVWREHLRIYEIEHLVVRIVESDGGSAAPSAAIGSDERRETPMAYPQTAAADGLRFHGAAGTRPQTWVGADQQLAFDTAGILARLHNLEQPCYVVRAGGQIGAASTGQVHPATTGQGFDLLAELPPLLPQQLGDPTFLQTYGVQAAYYAGAMANGIASEEMVIALGRAGLLGSFGAAGLVPTRVAEAIQRMQQALPNGPYACNLIHSPNEEALERGAVEMFLRHGVKTVEASAFLALTPHVVRYRVAGLQVDPQGQIVPANRIIAKLSRPEVATQFLQPAPARLLRELVAAGEITEQQARLAEHVPIADDLTVEADSGGHTDNRPLLVLLPAILALRDEMQAKQGYATAVRVGAAGGIGTPLSALAAFMAGAAYVVTGSVNQGCIEAGTSQHTRNLLAQAGIADVMMAPSADMFEMGVKVQLLKKGTLFPMRAQKLYDIYQAYDSLEAIPAAERTKLERQVFQKSLETVWEETVAYFSERDPEQIARAADKPKRKMALIFRWYLGLSSRWSNTGASGREMDYQIWCGPAMGAFNAWVRGSYLEDSASRSVVDIAWHILRGAAVLYRLQSLKLQGLDVPARYSHYQPMPLTPGR